MNIQPYSTATTQRDKNSSNETTNNIPTADSSFHYDKIVQVNLGLYSVSQGEGSRENFTEFLMQKKSEGSGLFPPPSETECMTWRFSTEEKLKILARLSD